MAVNGGAGFANAVRSHLVSLRLSSDFSKACRDHIFGLRFRLEQSREDIEQAKLVWVTSQWLLDEFERTSQAGEQPEE